MRPRDLGEAMELAQLVEGQRHLEGETGDNSLGGSYRMTTTLLKSKEPIPDTLRGTSKEKTARRRPRDNFKKLTEIELQEKRAKGLCFRCDERCSTYPYRWLSATLVDFYVNVVAIAVWVAYKESSWLSTCFWVILLVCFGSISTCAYIVKQLFSISGQDSSQDPLQLVLLRKDGESKVNCSSVVLGRIVFSALGIIMSAIVVYTLVTDGWPFRMELLTPWMAATLIDFYINVFAISVWVFHKESTWIRAIFWVCLLICLGR
ncbi:uncharacterized protein LOC110093648 [Dendrobium catenatum]|uniref:uncharacterized protein LOC110093648 n=1 Tax=Dendrobium catenatum TaxID=906689 RepID=UPI0009F1B2E3|nr:uncharacterized protein LOC110093648 [Dendrobium catenatum]